MKDCQLDLTRRVARSSTR